MTDTFLAYTRDVEGLQDRHRQNTAMPLLPRSHSIFLKSVSLFLFLSLLFVLQCLQPGPLLSSENPIGRLINPQGQVSVLPAGSVSWEEALNGRDLSPGDTVRTAQNSRVSILCIDETQLKLNENTVLVLKSSMPSPRLGTATSATHTGTDRSLYEVPKGEIWLRNKSEKVRFDVQTPAVTAAIRGTEFNLKVNEEGAAELVLLEGKIRLSNPQGEIDLDPGEEGMAEIGRAPVKRVLVQPDDAVQWSLYYPGIFSFRDIPLGSRAGEGSQVSPPIREAEAAYDRGDLDGSKSIAEGELARYPDNGPALVILGWISLQKQDPEKALYYLQRAAGQNARPELTMSGIALATYRLGNPARAYELMVSELKKSPSKPLLLVMAGYFSMLAGKIEEASAFLNAPHISGQEASMAHSLLSQMLLVQNHKKEAAAEAALALELNGQSPLARLTNGLVRIAWFDLPEARRFLDDALAADPHFLQAYLYMARIWLGSDYLDRARKCIAEALAISKNDSEVLSLAGFIYLGYRDFDKAFKLFSEAVKADPGFGDPHVGLSNIAFKNRNFSLGLTEMLTATLLEPRVSLYQSSLGKALYQTRAFDKALEVYDYAKTLDPRDPTPYLYKGIALSDLYRPGEAIQELNKSIELNDNMAVFRSRLMLDRDLAVRNTDLARAYNQLGLGDWAFSKALTAVKNDPLNASAHLFLSSAFTSTRQNVGASGSELLLYELLAPANENTFSQGTNGSSDYTQMFEMPYARLQANTGIGTWTNHEAPIQADSIEVFLGRPGLALDVYGAYQNDPGYRKSNDNTESFFGFAQGKYEPTIKDSFYANYTYNKILWGGTGNPDNFTFQNDPNVQNKKDNDFAEGGYIHRFSPEAVFIGYFKWGNEDWRTSDSYFFTTLGYPTFENTYERQLQDFNNVQLQQQLKAGDHTFIAGFDYFTGYLDYYFRDSFVITDVSFPYNIIYKNGFFNQYKPPDRATSVYIRDYWRISPQLLMELGVSGDFLSSSRANFPDSISSATTNPLVGFNYEIDKSNTLRLALQSYVNGHSLSGGSIAPSETAGFPSQINADDGSKVKELGFAWESQWNPLTFTVLRLTAHRIDNPQFEYVNSSINSLINSQTERFQGSFTANRLLTSSLGLSAGISGKLVSLDAPPNTFTTGDFSEIDGAAALSYMHPSGWFASIRDTLAYQSLGDLSDKNAAQTQAGMGNPFNLVDISFGKYFDNKRGYASLGITNIFNQHFYYQTEPVELWSFFPDRTIMFRFGLYF